MTGKMTISDNYCFIKVVPYDDTNIWTPSPGVRMTPSTSRIHHQRWRMVAVLTGRMTISDKDCFTKVVSNFTLFHPHLKHCFEDRASGGQEQLVTEESLINDIDHYVGHTTFKSISSPWA